MNQFRAIAAALVMLAIAAVAARAFADELRITAKPGQWVLRDPAATPIKELGRYDTAELCQNAAPAPGKYRCDTSVQVEAVGVCSATAPAYPVVLDAQRHLIKPALQVLVAADGAWGPVQMEGYVKGPGYPACWVMGWVPYVQPVDQLTDEGPPEPVGEVWSAALEELHENPVSVAIRALP